MPEIVISLADRNIGTLKMNIGINYKGTHVNRLRYLRKEIMKVLVFEFYKEV